MPKLFKYKRRIIQTYIEEIVFSILALTIVLSAYWLAKMESFRAEDARAAEAILRARNETVDAIRAGRPARYYLFNRNIAP